MVEMALVLIQPQDSPYELGLMAIDYNGSLEPPRLEAVYHTGYQLLGGHARGAGLLPSCPVMWAPEVIGWRVLC